MRGGGLSRRVLVGALAAALGCTLAAITPPPAHAACESLLGLIQTSDCAPPPCNQATSPDGAVATAAGLSALPAPRAGERLFPRTPGNRLPFGFSDNAVDRGRASVDEVARMHRAMGGTIVRQGVAWGRVQSSRDGPACFDIYDVLYRTYVEQGIRPIFVVLSTPPWAATDASDCSRNFCMSLPKPSAYPEFRAFVGELARRYPLAAAIEIWNEPNLPHFYGDREPDPVTYADVLAEGYAGVKAARPAMRVLGGALAPNPSDHHQSDGHVRGLGSFLAGMLAHGAAANMDGLSFHPYPLLNDPGFFAETFAQVRDTLAAAGAADERLVADEIGLRGSLLNPLSQDTQSQVLLARYLDLDRARAAVPLSDQVDAALFYTSVDSTSGEDNGYGWVSPKTLGTFWPKPVFCAFRSAAGGLGESCNGIS
jgi:hypothetical protein